MTTLKAVIGADPAANAEFAVTVPAGESWRLLSASVNCVQGATQTPQPILTIDEGLGLDGALGTVTVTQASPGVFTRAAHGLVEGDQFFLKTTGALLTGLAVDTIYFVIAAGLTADAFQASLTRGGAAINTTGTQSGTHSLFRVPVLFEAFGSSAAQAVSTTCRYTWAPDLPLSAQVGATVNVHSNAPLPEFLILPAGSRIVSNTLGKGANTNYGAPTVLVAVDNLAGDLI